MSLNIEERTAIVEFRLEKAQRAYEQACGVVDKSYWETIANRLYYAAYNAVSALLIAYGYSAQSHSGVIHLFGQHFIKTGILSRENGKLYHDLFTMRLTGDYDDTYGLAENDVLPYMEPAKQLIQEVTALALKQIEENARQKQ